MRGTLASPCSPEYDENEMLHQLKYFFLQRIGMVIYFLITTSLSLNFPAWIFISFDIAKRRRKVLISRSFNYSYPTVSIILIIVYVLFRKDIRRQDGSVVYKKIDVLLFCRMYWMRTYVFFYHYSFLFLSACSLFSLGSGGSKYYALSRHGNFVGTNIYFSEEKLWELLVNKP